MRVELGGEQARAWWRRPLLVLIALAVVLITVLLLVVLRTVVVMGHEARTHRLAWLQAQRSEVVVALEAYQAAVEQAASLDQDPDPDDQPESRAEGDLAREVAVLRAQLAENREALTATLAEIDRRIARWESTGDLAAGFDRDLQAWHLETTRPQPTTR